MFASIAFIEPLIGATYGSHTTIADWLVGNTSIALVIALAALAVDRFAKRPALTHLLWVLVLIKLVAPPIAAFPVFVDPSVLESSATRSIADSTDSNRMVELARSIGSLKSGGVGNSMSLPIELLLGWCAGSLLMAAWIIRASKRVHRMIEQRGRFDITATRQLASLASESHRKLPPVWLVDAVVSPMLVSPLLRRMGGEVRIVFPKLLWSRLDEDARAVLLLHELEHFRRQDWIVRFIEVATLAILWWHPLVWIAKLQIEDCEERCCDLAASTRSHRSPRVYAEAILKTLDFLCEPVERNHCEIEPRPVASGVGHLPKLQHRLRQIMKPTSSGRFGRTGFVAVSGMLLLVPIYPVIVLDRSVPVVNESLILERPKPTILTAGSDVEPEPTRRLLPSGH